MAPPNNLVIIYLLLIGPIWVSVNLDFANSRVISKQGDCVNCTICPYPCRSVSPSLPPSSASGYPLYGAPPPPDSGYQSYVAPPPPDAQGQGSCTPAPPQCCQYPPPAPPNIYYPRPVPPNTYTYFPSDSISPTPFPTIFLASVMMFLASFAL